MNERWIENIDLGNVENGEIILTSYFASKPNPQPVRDNPKIDSLEYILPWYNSVNTLGLFGIVFHDGLSEKFIKRHTSKKIRFVKCELGRLSLNDERFIIYHQFLNTHIDKISSVFMTDSNDVQIQHNPFDYISRFDQSVIFVGRNNGNRIRQSRFNLAKFKPFEESSGIKLENNFIHQALYNAGILGGEISNVITFLGKLSEILRQCDSGNNNMIAFNYVLFRHYQSNANSIWNRFLGLWLSIGKYQKLRKVKHNRVNKEFFDLQPDHRSFEDKLGNQKRIHTSGPFCSKFKEYSTDSSYIFIHK